jgi:hypothetical protein
MGSGALLENCLVEGTQPHSNKAKPTSATCCSIASLCQLHPKAVLAAKQHREPTKEHPATRQNITELRQGAFLSAVLSHFTPIQLFSRSKTRNHQTNRTCRTRSHTRPTLQHPHTARGTQLQPLGVLLAGVLPRLARLRPWIIPGARLFSLLPNSQKRDPPFCIQWLQLGGGISGDFGRKMIHAQRAPLQLEGYRGCTMKAASNEPPPAAGPKVQGCYARRQLPSVVSAGGPAWSPHAGSCRRWRRLPPRRAAAAWQPGRRGGRRCTGRAPPQRRPSAPLPP